MEVGDESAASPPIVPDLATIYQQHMGLASHVTGLSSEMSALRTTFEQFVSMFSTTSSTSAPPFSASSSMAAAPSLYPAPSAKPASSSIIPHELLKALKPATFSGRKDMLQPWLSTTTDTLKLAGMDLQSPASVIYGGLLLTGAAKLLWDRQVKAHPPDGGCSTWAQFCNFLTRHLDDPYPEETARRKLRDLSQTGSIASYNREYLRLISYLPNRSPSDVLADYIHGLKHDVQAWVLQAKAGTLEDAMCAAHQADETMRRHGRMRPSSYYTPRGDDPMDLGTVVASAVSAALSNLTVAPTRGRPAQRASIKPARNRSATPAASQSRSASRSSHTSRSHSASPRLVPLNQLSDDELAELRAKGLCFYCRKPGHMLRDCPKRRARNAGKRVSFNAPKN